MNPEQEIKNFFQKKDITIFAGGSVQEIKKDFPLSKELDLSQINYAIIFACPLPAYVLEGIKDRPTLLYKHIYRQVNYFLDRTALELALWLEAKGKKAIPIPASQIIDWEKKLGHLSHRQVGVHLGLGFYGRNNLLVHPEYGSQLRLVTVLTDWEIDLPGPVKNQSLDCGACTACVEVCPAGAIHTSPADFDRTACFSQVREFEKMRGIGVGICGICVRACKGRRK